MSTSRITDFVAKLSSEEKKSLLRELTQNQPISSEKPSATPVDTVAPADAPSEDDFFNVGSPGFFRELERREREDPLLSVEEFAEFLRSKSQ